MKKSNFKKLLSGIISASMLVAALPMSMAQAALDTNDLNVLYEEDYEGGTVGNVIKVEKGKAGFANATDPKDSSNKVLRIYTTADATDPYGKYINARIGSTAENNPWGGGTWGTTYEAEGALENRPLVYEMDIYVPSDIKDDLKADYNADLNFGPLMTAGNPGGFPMAYAMGVDTDTGNQPMSGDAWLGQNNWAKKCTFSLDTWYKFKWVITGEGNSTKVSVFMSKDDGTTYTTVYNNVDADYKYNRSTTLMHGIGISSRGAVAVASETTGVFVDNVKIYQIKNAFDAELNFDQLNAKGKINFTNKITADDLTNIVIKNPSGTAVTANKQLSADGKTVTFSFDGELESSATYTVDLSTLVDVYGQAIETKTLTFVTAKNLIKVIYSEDYEGGTVGNVIKVENGKAGFANATDPKDSSNKVLRIYTTANSKDSYGKYINARIGSTAENNPWGGGTWGTTYEAEGALENRPLVYEMDIYVPSDIKDDLKADYNADLNFGPLMTAGNPGGFPMAYAMGVDTASEGAGNPGGAEAWLGQHNWAKHKAFSLDTWYKFKWVITGEGDSTKVSVYMSTDDGATYTTVYNNVDADYKYNRSTTLMHGIGISSRGAVAVASETTGVLIDNVKIWQCESAFALESVTYDPNEGAILAKTGTRPTQTAIDSITLKRGEEDVTSLITSRAWDDVNSTLKLYVPFASLNVSTEYTLTIPAGSADIYNQVLTTESTANFTTPKSKSVAVKTASVTAEPTASGATVSITLENVAETPGSAWIIMGVYGAYNQLLGVDSTVKENIAKGTADAFTLTTGDNCSAAEEIRVFVWDSPDTIVPLQKSEVVWTKPATE